MQKPVLTAENLSLTLASGGEKLHVLKGVNLTLLAGEIVALVGPSGSGKTSLLMVLAGLERVSSGKIVIDGTDLSGLNEDQLAVARRKNLSIVFQNFHLVPSMTALENVALALEVAEPNRKYGDIRATAAAALAEVGLSARASHLPSALSGGEQQRVALARAVVTGPRLLLADEPTGNLDQDTGARVIDQMLALARGRGTAILLVTHDRALAARADRMLIMDQGHLTEQTKVPA